jgi:hypothetical protein
MNFHRTILVLIGFLFSSTGAMSLESLDEYGFVIFSHKFDLKLKNGSRPSSGEPKDVTLKFILLETHSHGSNDVVERLVLFQNKDPKSKDQNSNKWIWSEYNPAPPPLTRSEAHFLLTNLFYSAISDAFIVRNSQATVFSFPEPLAPQKSLSEDLDDVSIESGYKIEETPVLEKFLNALGDRIQNVPGAVPPVLIPPAQTKPPLPTFGTGQVRVDLRAFLTHPAKPRSQPVAVPEDDFVCEKDEVTTSWALNLKAPPFNVASPASPFCTANGKTYIRMPPNSPYFNYYDLSLYSYVSDWILADYAANNSTPESASGKEFCSFATARVDFEQVSDHRRVHFYPMYATGQLPASTIAHSFDATPKGSGFDLDMIALLPYIYGWLEGSGNQAPCVIHGSPRPDPSALGPMTGAWPVGSSPGLRDSSGSTAQSKTSGFQLPYKFSPPSFPDFGSDSSGTYVNSSYTVTPVKQNGWWPSLDLKGGIYFDHDYYNGTAGLTWSIPTEKTGDTATSSADTISAPAHVAPTTDDTVATNWTDTLGPQVSRTVQPNGNSTATKDAALMTGKIILTHGDDSYTWQESAGVGRSLNAATNVATDEYYGTTYTQQLWGEHFPLDWPLTSKAKAPDGSVKRDPPHFLTMQIDMNEWLKPAQATQTESFYTANAARLHLGADVPSGTFCDAPQFIRVDAMLTGGEIGGNAPDTDRFYGGNTGGQGNSSADLPSPVVRSFGTGKLGVYPSTLGPNAKEAGPTSFANANCTIVFPGLAVPFLSDADADQLNKIFDPNNANAKEVLDSGEVNRDLINYIANYDDRFSAKPIFTCDAAFLGGPNGYANRNLVSVGGGVELSITALNLDILYEVTLHDTAAAQQPLGENIIAQLSYDIHF